MLAFAVENLAVLPLRWVVTLPIAVIALIVVGPGPLPHEARMWGLWLVAMVGAWAITFFASFAIGSLAFYFESSLKVMEVWLTLFFVFSGYVAPVDLFPAWLRGLADVLPFRYQIALPVEILTSACGWDAALSLIARQWTWVAVLVVAALLLWRGGLKRFAAYGG